MSEIKIIVVSGKEIIESGTLDISTTLSDSEYFLLEGTVYQSNLQPLANAAIKVFSIDEKTEPPIIELAGITFTIEDGTFGISLLCGGEYMIIVYS